MAESDLIERKKGQFAGEMMVYASLHRMIADGLIVGEWALCDGRRRRCYRLTDLGRRMLKLNARRRLSRTAADTYPGGGSGV